MMSHTDIDKHVFSLDGMVGVRFTWLIGGSAFFVLGTQEFTSCPSG